MAFSAVFCKYRLNIPRKIHLRVAGFREKCGYTQRKEVYDVGFWQVGYLFWGKI
jgi:hypothetical protein